MNPITKGHRMEPQNFFVLSLGFGAMLLAAHQAFAEPRQASASQTSLPPAETSSR
jgi:hypothetical protein